MIYKPTRVFRRNDLFESTESIDSWRKVGEGIREAAAYGRPFVILNKNDPVTACAGQKNETKTKHDALGRVVVCV